MNPPLSYSLLALSLGGIFAAGGSIGYWLGRSAAPPAGAAAEMIGSAPGASAREWADQAFNRLAGDLSLTEPQRQSVRPLLLTAGGRVFVERDRALLQMHLRLLEVHDQLAGGTVLDPGQKQRLLQSRKKLKASILGRFADILKDEPGSAPDL